MIQLTKQRQPTGMPARAHYLAYYVYALAPVMNLQFQAVVIYQEHDAGSMLHMFARSC
jgi:hypothetical protein